MIDRVTEYAQDVDTGKIVASESVVCAARRHLSDLESAGKRGYVWDLKSANRIINFIERIIILTGGKTHGEPFKLLGWQAFVVGCCFGWLDADTGYRRFRKAYIHTGKGSGKTPLIAAVGLYGLIADGEKEAQIFVAAQTAEQGLVTFKQMCHFIQESKLLQDQPIEIYGGDVRPETIWHTKNRSFIKRIASEKYGRGKSGFIPHMVVIDEYHEHDSSATLDWLEAGTKNRRQPLVFITTNAGAGASTPCGLENERALRVARGVIEDDSYFAYVCGLDEGDEPFADETCWIKANPSLPLIPGYSYIRQQVASCKGMPGRESVVKRLNFCVWMGAETPWLTAEKWAACEREALSDWEGRPVFIGLDLSRRSDLTAAVKVCAMGVDDEGRNRYEAKAIMWMPEDTVDQHERDENIPYRAFAELGYLELCAGDFINKNDVALWIRDQLSLHNVQGVVYDRWGFDEVYNALTGMGVEISTDHKLLGQALVLLGHPQGFSPGAVIDGYGRLGMPSSITALEAAIREGRVEIKKNPLMRAAAEGSVVVLDQSSNRRFVKEKSRSRIDPMIALTMAVGAAELFTEGSGSDIARMWQGIEKSGQPLVWTAG